jgi:DNA-binding transcriptional ArsR family regulator
MPISIVGLDNSGAAPPAAAVSALVEFGSALHVLRDPGHHGAAGWAADVRAMLSPRLAARAESWWWTAQAIRSTPFVTAVPAAGEPGASGAPGEFGGQLGRLRAMPPRQLAGELLRPISPSGDPRAALHWSRSRGPGVAGVVAALVTRPDDAVADFVSFLEESWRAWFAAEWARIQPGLAARARAFADTVTRHGAVAALSAVDPSVTPAGRGVSIAKVQSARHDVSRRGLLVTPSTYIRPHLYVADVPGRPLLLIHPADAGPPVPSAAELTRRLDAVAHRGRLEVARAIATEPRTAGEVAGLWNLDPTLVNRHLRALASAGLARTTRRGRFVQYQLDADAVAAIGTDLAALLLR